MASDRELKAATFVERYGQAVRGDWSALDGRSVRDAMDEVAAFLRGERDDLSLSNWYVCEEGAVGHWLPDSYHGYCSLYHEVPDGE